MNLRPLLVASVGLNFALLAWTTFRWANAPKPIVIPVRIIRTNTIVRVSARTITVREPAPAPEPLDWQRIESTDYRQFIANLRSIKCPEETVRDLISAELAKAFAKKFQELAPGTQRGIPRSYWQTDGESDRLGAAALQKLRQEIRSEHRAVLEELLGTTASAFLPTLSLEWQSYGEAELLRFLPSEKAGLVAALRERRATTPGTSPEATSELDNALNKMLSPRERYQYDLWFSETAASLRQQLKGFAPTEKEFLALYELKRALKTSEEKRGDTLAQPATQSQDALLLDSAKQILSKERFLDFQRSQEPQFQDMLALATEMQAPPGAALKLAEIQTAAQEEMDRLIHAPGMDAQEFESSAREIHGETERAVLEALGKTSVKDLGKAYPRWLQNLQHPKRPLGTPTTRPDP